MKASSRWLRSLGVIVFARLLELSEKCLTRFKLILAPKEPICGQKGGGERGEGGGGEGAFELCNFTSISLKKLDLNQGMTSTQRNFSFVF
jgi:hypothetical protein